MKDVKEQKQNDNGEIIEMKQGSADRGIQE